MATFNDKIANLSPEKRELLDLFLKQEGIVNDLLEEYVPPKTNVEKKLAKIWQEVLGIERVGIQDDYFKLGGDSILSIQIAAKARQAGLELDVNQLLEYPTISELASVMKSSPEESSEQGLVTGPVPLTPIQKWFFEQKFEDMNHWNQAVMLEAVQELDTDVLERAVGELLVHHDTLRMRFTARKGVWEQTYAYPDACVPFTKFDFSQLPESELEKPVLEAADKCQKKLNLADGPLVQVGYFSLGGRKPDRLLFVAHHLVVDWVSFRTLLGDLQLVYEQLASEKPAVLPSKTTSFQKWSELLSEYADAPEIQEELAYWTSKLDGLPCAVPKDLSGGSNIEAYSESITTTLGPDETKNLIQKMPSEFRANIDEILLTALSQALASWTDCDSVLIDLEGHGRNELLGGIDLSRTV